MSDLLEFLTSKEIIVIYIIAGIACFICFIIYLVKANSAKYRMKNNTRELNKLVEQIQEEMPEVKNKKEETYQKPVLQVINNENYSNINNASSVNELLESTAELKPVVDSVNKEVALPTTLEEKEEIKERSIMDIMPEVNKEEAISFESTVSNYQETPVYSEPLIISSTNPENYVSNDAVSYHEQIVIENTLEETSIDDTVNEIVNEYIENGYKNTGAENVVTALILDYRGFDTLGETFVLFTAVLAVLILLKEISPKKRIDTYKLQNDIIFSSIAKLIIPLIFLYALYVLFNGESSPGGGFSGGTIMGVGLMVYSMAFGEEKAHKLFNETTFKVVTSVALCCYVGVKCYAFFTQLKAAEALGGYIMLIMDLCVGAVVASTMYSFYSLFTKGEI